LRPQPAIAPSIRRIATPEARPVGWVPVSAPLLAQTSASPGDHRWDECSPRPALIAKPSTVAPLSADHYKIQFTIPTTTHDKLRRVQDLMRHTAPNGDPAVIFDRALTPLVDHLERAKLGKTTRNRKQQPATRPGSRHVPSAVKREVWARDVGRCAFASRGKRCSETGFLEYHHVIPYAEGGETTAANIQLRCRAHNAYEAEDWFGPLVVAERHSDDAAGP
jgi:5-methylcytosine-specific restriction endonuclease McrA